MSAGPITPSTRDVQRLLDTPGRQHVVLQPIVDLQVQKIAGYEALSRFIPGTIYGPVDWFHAARRAGLDMALEAKACSAAMSWISRIPDDRFISVNLSPDAVMCEEIRMLLQPVDHGRVVVELTEQADSADAPAQAACIHELRCQGIRLAIDDIGAGYASFTRILQLNADFLKVDRGLVQGCAADPMRRYVLEVIASLAQKQGGRVVAEGVECADDLRVVHEIGIRYVQGYLLGKPGPRPAELTDDHRRALEVINDQQLVIELGALEQSGMAAQSAEARMAAGGSLTRGFGTE